MTSTADILELFAEAAQLGVRCYRRDGLTDRSCVNFAVAAQRGERLRLKRWRLSRRAAQRRRDCEVKAQWLMAASEARAERRAYLLSLPPLEIRSEVCGSCGAVVEHRPGVRWPVHLGQAASSRCRRA